MDSRLDMEGRSWVVVVGIQGKGRDNMAGR